MADERGTPPTPGDCGRGGGAGEVAWLEVAIQVLLCGCSTAPAAGEDNALLVLSDRVSVVFGRFVEKLL